MSDESAAGKVTRRETLRIWATPITVLIAAAGIAVPAWQNERAEERRQRAAFQLEAAWLVMSELDGELVAWKGSEPYFPLVCRRVLNRDGSVPLTFVIFDVLRQKGVDLTTRPYSERRRRLERLKLDGQAWTTSEIFDDGQALFTAVCELGFEGVVAKNQSSLYRPNGRGWVKVKNPTYWRRDAEREAMSRKHERRARTRV